MDIPPFVIGCDVSKAKIDVFDAAAGKHATVVNDAAGLDRFLAPFAGRHVRFAFEATGCYANGLRKALARHGLAGIQINPLHARRYAQSTGRLAKTDRIDAAQLAAMAQRLELQKTPEWDDDTERLKALIMRRDQLVDMRAGERRRSQQVEADVVTASIARHIDALSEEIAAFDALIEQAIAGNRTLRTRYEALVSIPGIGPATAPVLLALLPEAGTAGRSAIASLAGVAPMARDSGVFTGRRSIAGGRPRIRRALYQAAMGAIAGHSRFADRYRRLIDAGKPPKVALIAVARNIITTANAILKTGQTYAP